MIAKRGSNAVGAIMPFESPNLAKVSQFDAKVVGGAEHQLAFANKLYREINKKWWLTYIHTTISFVSAVLLILHFVGVHFLFEIGVLKPVLLLFVAFCALWFAMCAIGVLTDIKALKRDLIAFRQGNLVRDVSSKSPRASQQFQQQMESLQKLEQTFSEEQRAALQSDPMIYTSHKRPFSSPIISSPPVLSPYQQQMQQLQQPMAFVPNVYQQQQQQPFAFARSPIASQQIPTSPLSGGGFRAGDGDLGDFAFKTPARNRQPFDQSTILSPSQMFPASPIAPTTQQRFGVSSPNVTSSIPAAAFPMTPGFQMTPRVPPTTGYRRLSATRVKVEADADLDFDFDFDPKAAAVPSLSTMQFIDRAERVSRRLAISRDDLYQWNSNIKEWLSNRVLTPLINTIKEVDSVLLANPDLAEFSCAQSLDSLASPQLKAKLPQPASQSFSFSMAPVTPSINLSGNVTLQSALEYFASQSPNMKSIADKRIRIEPYLQMSSAVDDKSLYRQYVIQRIKQLNDPELTQFKWDAGAPEFLGRKWAPHLFPTDAKIVMHIFCRFMDAVLQASQMSSAVKSANPFTERYFDSQDDDKSVQTLRSSLFISQLVSNPPYFCVRVSAFPSPLYTHPGRDNVFHAIVLFVFMVRKLQNEGKLLNDNELSLAIRDPNLALLNVIDTANTNSL